jgi:hypothetical protein
MAVEYAGTGNDDGIIFGRASSDKIGFFGLATAVSQRAGAAQATSLVATASSADVTTELKAAVIEIMNTLTAYGLWKGAA